MKESNNPYNLFFGITLLTQPREAKKLFSGKIVTLPSVRFSRAQSND